MPKLLSRAEFRESAMARDHHQCVACPSPATDVHHVMERRLWLDGGYYLENAASLCPACHLKAEQTLLGCDVLREAVGIATRHLPDHLSTDEGENYDKWGNQILPSGERLRGELWWEESCQKALAAGGVLGLYSDRVKYPRTMHLPWSPNLKNDDRRIFSIGHFLGEEVVVTLKMDGENTTLMQEHCHARSRDSRHHPSRGWVKTLHGIIQAQIPPDWRICGENLYALHSIPYENLRTFFYVFNIWEKSRALSWDETVAYAGLIGLETVPVLYRGPFNQAKLAEIQGSLDPDRDEGYVIRTTGPIAMGEWRYKAAKWVRNNHVNTGQHWMDRPVVPNRIGQGYANPLSLLFPL